MSQKPTQSRKEVFQFRLNKQERQEIDRRAKSLNMKAAEYVRMVATGAAVSA